jgi:hypothetical protein
MTTAKEINHDSSTTIGNHYTTVTDVDGAIAVNGTAALAGSTYGVEMDYDAGANNVTLKEPVSLAAATEFRMRFRVDLTPVAYTGAGVNAVIIELQDSGTGRYLFQTVIKFTGSVFTLDGSYDDDDGGFAGIAGNHPLSANKFCIELAATRETADGNADGTLAYYVNGQLSDMGILTGIANFNIWSGLDEVEVRFLSADALVTGSIYYDEWILDDDSDANLSCVFTGYDLVIGGGQP